MRGGCSVKTKVKHILVITVLLLMCCSSIAYAGRVGPLTTKLPYSVQYTPKVDIFRFNESNAEFILLDFDEEGFFVTTKGAYGTHAYDPNITGKFDINDENNIAYWLNNDFLNNGNSDEESGIERRLPDVIIRHIIEHDWLCEAGNAVSDFPEDYIVKAKLALMSLTEYKQYAAKIGYADTLDVSSYYFMRTVNGTATDSPIMVMYPGGTVNYGKAWNTYGVRPVFYLDRETFIEDKLNIDYTGDNVKKIIRDAYSYEELEGFYTADELKEIYKKFAPQITDINLSGVQRAGKTLTVNYKYISPEEESEGETIIRWMRSKNKNGPYGVIRNENDPTYTMKNSDAGYYIMCEVVPVSETKQIGYAKRSSATSTAVKGSTAPYAENVKIIGDVLVGNRLIALYDYIDDNDSMETGTIVKWQRSKDNVNFETIKGEESANLIIPEDCAGYYIRCIVTVHNEVEAGASVISKPVGPVDYLPEVVRPVIECKNEKAVLTTPVGNNDKVIWLSRTDSEVMGISQYGSIEYVLNGTETAIKAMIIYYSDSGIMCGIETSNILKVNDKQNIEVGNNSIKTSGREKVRITSVGEQLAYSIKLVCSTTETKILGATSDEYSVYSYEEEGRVTYILTKKSINGARIPDTILELQTEGNGEMRIDAVEAVYETETGESVIYKPKLSLVGGVK